MAAGVGLLALAVERTGDTHIVNLVRKMLSLF